MHSRARGLALALVPLALCRGAAAQETSYVLRPGDRITVEVFSAAGERVEVVSGQRILDRDGGVYLPYVGTVHLSGMSEPAVRSLLESGFARFYDEPVLTVSFQLRVNVTGAVDRPGQYFLDPTATLVDALSLAGGASSELAFNASGTPADPTRVRLVRDGATSILNFRPDDVSTETIGMHVRSGDWLHVPVRPRSRVREEIVFWGGVVGLVTSVTSLIILIGR